MPIPSDRSVVVRRRALAIAHAAVVALVLAAVVLGAGCAGSSATLPGAPTDLTVGPLDGGVVLRWTLGDDGGSPLTNHAYSLDDGATWAAFAPPVVGGSATIVALPNGVIHRLRIRAVNARGPGAPSSAVDALAAKPAYLLGAHGDGLVSVQSLASTADGGVVAVGFHDSEITFGDLPMAPSNDSGTGFIAKVDADGRWSWRVDLDTNEGSRVETVTAFGDGVAVAGRFRGTLALGGAGTFEAPTGGVFVATLDADGTWTWADVALYDTFATHVSIYGIAVDAADDLVVTGDVEGAVTFGVHTTADTGFKDAFVASAVVGGSWAWVAGAGSDGPSSGRAMVVADDGRIVVAGTTRAAVPFAGLPATATTSVTNGFVAVLGSDRTWQWANTFGGALGVAVHDVAIVDGAAVVVGWFRSGETFGPFGTVAPPMGASSASFILDFGIDDGWRRMAVLEGSDEAYLVGVTARPGGGLVVAGNVRGDVALDGVPAGQAGAGPYVAVLDSDGAFVAARSLDEGPNPDSSDVTAFTLGLGSIPVLAGEFKGSLSDTQDVIAHDEDAAAPDLFVWKSGPVESW